MISIFNTDLHIHSCLSPCADDNMTPHALVSAAKAAGLDLIALTDHNSCKNCAAAAAAAQELGISFIPGLEVTTQEDIHCICLFPELSKALSFSRWLDSLAAVPAKPPKPGSRPQTDKQRQLEERKRLYMARRISVMELHAAARRYRGLCWPAHVKKAYNSLYAVLGAWPEELEADGVELFAEDKRPTDVPAGVRSLRVSDAHRLRDIKGGFPLPLDTPDFAGLERYLRG